MKAKKIIVSVIAICIAATTGCSASPLANFKPVQTVPQSDLVAPENSIGISFPTETEKPTNTSTPADTSKTPESTDKPSVNESSLTHAEAKKIVDNTIENMKSAVKAGNKTEFSTFFSTAISSETIKEYWDLMTNHINNGTKEYKTDNTILAFTDKEIIFDLFFYWNYVDPDNIYTNRNSHTTSPRLFLLKDGDLWKMHYGQASDELADKYQKSCVETYGEKAYYNGFCTGNYQIKNNRSILAGINVDVFTAYINDDGSINLVLGIQNGYDFTRYFRLTKGNISFGKNSETAREYINLLKDYDSDYDLSNLELEPRSVRYVELTIPKNQLLNELNDKNEFAYCNFEVSNKSQNDPYKD